MRGGVAVDDRFDFDVELTYQNATLDLAVVDQMYVIIDDLPGIVDNVTSLAQLSVYDFTTYWDNGTVMDDVWHDIVHIIPFSLFPVGNWSLITKLVEDRESLQSMN